MKQIKLDQILNSDEPDCIDFQVLARESARREETRASFSDVQCAYYWDGAYFSDIWMRAYV